MAQGQPVYVGTLDPDDFKEIMQQVTEEGWQAYEETYDMVWELLTKPAQRQHIEAIAQRLGPEQMDAITAVRPDLAAQIMRGQREQMEAV